MKTLIPYKTLSGEIELGVGCYNACWGNLAVVCGQVAYMPYKKRAYWIVNINTSERVSPFFTTGKRAIVCLEKRLAGKREPAGDLNIPDFSRVYLEELLATFTDRVCRGWAIPRQYIKPCALDKYLTWKDQKTVPPAP